MNKPVVYDFFCGLFGWGAAFLSQGYRVVGFDIADMHAEIGLPRPREVELVLQDVRSIHGSQFKDAAVIVASPPCQKYSYMAMPWKRAKALAAWYREDPSRQVELNELFNACFRIQREASEAAGRHIPLIVENVRGAQPWVGRSAWNFGSYHLWGDVPALMPIPRSRGNGEVSPHWRMEALKVPSESGRRTDVGNGARFTSRDCGKEAAKDDDVGNKMGGDWFSDPTGSKSKARKAASAAIAKIPFPLAQHVAQCFKEVRA